MPKALPIADAAGASALATLPASDVTADAAAPAADVISEPTELRIFVAASVSIVKLKVAVISPCNWQLTHVIAIPLAEIS